MMRLISNLIGIGRVSMVDDGDEVQRLQVTEGATGTGFADRIIDRVLRVADFGFASAPPIDSEALMLRRSGDRGKSIVIGTSHRASRPRNLKPGDVEIYDVRGAKVMLTADGLLIDCAGLPAIVQNATTITLKATTKVILDAPAIEVTGTFKAAGEITARTGGVAIGVGALRDAYDLHKHGTSPLTDHPA